MRDIEADWERFSGFLANEQRRAIGSELLFRGHADSAWKLESTLERRGLHRMFVGDYYRLARRALVQIESVTGKRWDLPAIPDVLKLVENYDEFSRALSFGGLPGYDYLAYARHHGFPSPLLDWTRSPYVAAYFAFAERNNAEKRSIYVWQRGKIRAHSSNSPQLAHLGPYVTTHRRHVLHQGSYTVCATFDTGHNQWHFTPQQAAFDAIDDIKDSDQEGFIWKFDFPSTDRRRVLAHLDEHNLNAFSLFESEESLMETLAVRELELAEDRPAASPEPPR